MNGSIIDRLREVRRVHIDSMTIIYFIERNPTYRPVVRPLFELLDSQQLMGLSSYVTLLEVMVRPIRERRPDLARAYRDTLVESRGFALFPVDRTIAENGAEIRATYGFRTPDSIQLATALRHGAEAFVTNDSKLKRFDRLQVLVLDDFRAPARS